MRRWFHSAASSFGFHSSSWDWGRAVVIAVVAEIVAVCMPAVVAAAIVVAVAEIVAVELVVESVAVIYDSVVAVVDNSAVEVVAGLGLGSEFAAVPGK